MKLYRKGVEVADIVIDEQTTFEWELQGGGLLSCDFTLPEMVEIKKNDYAIWRGRKFYAEDVIPVHKKKSNEFEYTFKMHDLYFFLKDAVHKFNDELDFYFYGDLRTQAQLLVDNFNRIGKATISLGAIPDTEPKNLKFADTDCESVLQQLCKEWGVEFILTESSLSFSEKIGNATGLTFKFKEGVRDIERNKVNDSSLVTKLYAFGGERNIPTDYGSKRLRIEAISKNTDKYGVVEGVKVFNDIYPHRTGAISALGDGICKFSDASLDFDINSQLIEGKSAKLTFTSGDLSGQEFEIHKYDHETKEFDIIKLTDSTGMEFPNANFKPKLGDKYVLHDIVMPDSYRVAAEARLRAKAQEFINKYSTPQCSYDITPDYVKLRRDAIELSVGDVLTVEDLDFNVSASNRIIGITQTIVSPFKYKIKVGDKATVSYLKRVLAKQLELDVALKVEKEDRQAEYRRTRRGLLQIEELQSSVFDQEGYFDTAKIKPLSIETNMLSVGSRNLRMSFEGLQIAPNYLSNVNSVKISASKLVHFTIEENVKEWNFLEQTINLADSTAYYYLYAKCNKKGTGGTYYATKEKLGLQDSTYYYFLIGVVHSAIDGVRGTSFQYGQTFINGKFITTGVVKGHTGKLVIDLDNGVVEVKNGGVFKGKFTFISGSEDIDLATWAGNTEVSVQKADGKARQALVKAQQVEADNEAKLKKLQEQIDNEISSYAYPYKPTPSNYPASEWTTEELKLRHDKDVFFNNKSFVDNTTTPDAGKAWRWMKMNGAWKWNQIADSDTVKALKEASKAQAMADGKSTLFGFTPNVVRADGFCYRQGDSWILNANKIINGTTYKRGEILTATQDSTAFNEAHWLKQVRYTDDTAVENLEIWHENLVEGGREERSGGNSEFLRTIDLAPIFDKYGLREYTLSFELKTKSATNKSEMYVYMQNGSGTKYSFVEKWVSVSEQYKLFTITATPVPKNTELPEAYLSFYGGYNTSNIPIVRKIKLQIGSKYTGDSISNADREAQIEKARQEATEAKQIGINAHSTAKAAQQSNKNLENYVDGAFEDNILTVAEKKSIEKYKNTLNEAMSKAEASYLKVYTNTYLLGTAKTNLSNAKISLWGQRDTLVNAINTALSSSTTVANIAARKTAIDSAFTSFNSKMKAFQEAIEEANKAIQEKLKSEAEANTRDAVKEVVTIKDTRSVNELPKFYYENYPRRTVREFKTLSIVALNKKATGHYCELETTVRWADASGGAVVQKATTDSNKVFTRASSSSTVWGEWKEIEDTESAKIKIELAKQEALLASSEVDKELKELKTKTQKFEKEVNGAFKDNIISEAEAKAIEKYKNTVATEKADVDAQYEKIYTDGDLIGVAKTNLAAKKTALNTAYSNLVSAINTAIKDWKTTPAEKINVDTKFSTYSTALGNLRKAFEEAIKAIEDKKIADAEAKIESLKNDLTPTKQQADYLSKALKQDSEVQGGLVLSSVVAARDSEGAVKSYMSGDPALNNVGFATGVKNFGTQGESQNVALRHDGTAKVGIFVIDAEGNIRVFDINNKERIGFYEHDIDTLQDIIAESTFSLEESGGAGVTHSFTSENFIVDGLSIVVPKNSGTLKLSASLVVDIKPECVFVGHEEDCSFSAVYNVNIILCKDGMEYLDLKNYQENIDTSDGGRITKNFEFNTSTVVPTGTYTVKVKKSIFVEVGKCSAFLSFVPKFTWNLDAGNFKKTVFGKNGFLSAFPHQLFYFTQEKGLVVNSQTDMPGLLATGSVTANGNVSNLWGAKVNNVNTPSKVSQGRYRVPHNIGHSNYTISVMCHSVGVVATVGTKASSYFEFYMQKNGNYYDSGFDYVVYGRNY